MFRARMSSSRRSRTRPGRSDHGVRNVGPASSALVYDGLVLRRLTAALGPQSMSTPALEVESFVVGPFQENCHFIRRADRAETVIIDPGDEAARLIRHLEQHALTPVAIVNTHAHLDHIGAVAPLHMIFGIP